ncbi:hypothetical protein BV25DRAFT_1818464 [Artomyces pyxidatus]|uniref:Uncharacterized protein n=1 Tax=Artomyces pyxidatus TaxID=48021 RepID=A0ACB8TI38_9AGAM|nr:hypothetical protein BV25DRAFT_1818464 [Artomyces pyxidatus]
MSTIPTPPPFPPNPLATQTYDQWENDTIKGYLSVQPDPTVPDSPAQIAQNRQLARRYKARMDLIVNNFAVLLQNRHDLKLADTLSEAKWKRYVLLARLFPINDLPTEILSNILRYVVWSTKDASESTLRRLQVTWVCHHWREMAIADQTLWNTIWFRDLPPYERSFNFFHRAGTAALDIRFNEDKRFLATGDAQYKLTGERMEKILDVIMTKVDQIRMLILVIDSWPPVLALFDRLRNSPRVPKWLERVEIHRTGRPYIWPGPDLPSPEFIAGTSLCAGNAPALHFLCLNGVHVNWNTSPMVNLTTLDLRRMPMSVGMTLQRFRDVLRASPKLKKLSLDGAGPFRPKDWNFSMVLPPIDLPDLTTALFGDFSMTYAIYAISNIHAPNVRDLSLVNMTGEDYGLFCKFMVGRFPNVVVLTMYTLQVEDTPQNTRYMVQWLMSMPLVQYLRVAALGQHMFYPFMMDGRYHLRDDFPLMLTPAQKAEIDAKYPREKIFPRLATLEFQHVDTDMIVNFGIGRRTVVGCPLKKIYINAVWMLHITATDRMKLFSISPVFICRSGNATPEEEKLYEIYSFGVAG